ncbi:MAG: hypothetical protein AVDCRST_MAG01-01-2076 [uncultured Rubrobacteraceae bacterium]|uniref:Uncharacterized protein n=1 Tax=uncultured Rubrobacteraceae bacterium TaxID=349277 RepID=A0A6J4PSF7_9ACTN|nr:MAG: hypothetical protein AVDCRST_MAG01-01-2076 [uncultured Rubrobacteraceae bacterium]
MIPTTTVGYPTNRPRARPPGPPGAAPASPCVILFPLLRALHGAAWRRQDATPSGQGRPRSGGSPVLPDSCRPGDGYV